MLTQQSSAYGQALCLALEYFFSVTLLCICVDEWLVVNETITNSPEFLFSSELISPPVLYVHA